MKWYKIDGENKPKHGSDIVLADNYGWESGYYCQRRGFMSYCHGELFKIRDGEFTKWAYVDFRTPTED